MRDVDDVCPECRATLVPLDDRPPRSAQPEHEQPAEPDAVVEPPKGRLRVAAAVAAVVLVGLAFVAGRGTGGTTARATTATTGAVTTTTVVSPASAQRQLGWKAGPKNGISLELVSITRTANADVSGQDAPGFGQDSEGDSTTTLHLRLNGLGADRTLLGVRGLRLIDLGGGVFATPDERPLGGEDAVPAFQDRGPGAYMLNLGTTPDLESLSGIDLDALILSSSPATGTKVDLPVAGAWPSRPPLREVSGGGRDLSVPVSLVAASSSSDLPLRLSSAFVGGGRAVIVLMRADDLSGDPGVVPLAASVLDGDRLVCFRHQEFSGGPGREAPLLVVDCPMRPTAQLALRLAAGVDSVELGAKLRD